MLWWCLTTAMAGFGLDPEPITWVRVEDPDYPGAIARSETASLLEHPPEGDVPWRYETQGLVDGWPGSLGVEVLNADLWHARGWRGQGVKLAVFDVQWEGSQGIDGELHPTETADCFLHPSCALPVDGLVAPGGFGLGGHGTGCADVVRDVAPDVELALVRVTGLTTLQSAARWAIRHDIDIISLSMSFFNESFYDGNGPFAGLLRELEAHDILLVTSAGNYARGHWSGRWKDGDDDGRLDVDGSNGFDLEYGSPGRKSVFVQWNEHAACGLTDLDVYAYGPGGELIGRSEDRQLAGKRGCSPLERVSIEVGTTGTARLEVVSRRVAASFLQLDVLSTAGVVRPTVVGASLTDPAAQPLAFVVGAVRASGYLDNDIEPFSSQGPTHGGAPKPDIAGPDGLTTEIFGTRGFFGTSAATPAVAASIALVMSRDPTLTPRQAAEKLQGWAWSDDTSPDPDDPRWGAGKARLPVPEALDSGCGGGAGALGWLPLLMVGGRRRLTPRRARE